jgi:hypothetical protein
MESFSVTHWIILAAVAASLISHFASPLLGVIRGVKNGSVLHAVLSVFVPVYGLIYFFVARPPRRRAEPTSSV